MTTWGEVLPVAEFVYNNSVNRSTWLSSFEVVTVYWPRKPIHLLPMSIDDLPSALAESFTQHLHELHEHIRRQIAINTITISLLQIHISCRNLLLEIKWWLSASREVLIGNFEKAPCRRVGSYRVLRSFGSNDYELNILRDLGINPVFNIKDLTLYHTSVAYPTAIPDEQYRLP